MSGQKQGHSIKAAVAVNWLANFPLAVTVLAQKTCWTAHVQPAGAKNLSDQRFFRALCYFLD
jgi:hypothetical protein